VDISSDSGIGLYATCDGEAAVSGYSPSGTGVNGESTSSYGVRGVSESGTGVHGYSTSNIGISGYSPSGIGVRGDGNVGVSGVSSSGVGVRGVSESSSGVNGLSTSSYGVSGQSDSFVGVSGLSGTGVGVSGYSTNDIGVRGESPSNVGISGYSTSDIGVYGQSTSFVGVYGQSDSSVGVHGQSVSSVGVYGVSVSGYAGLFDGTVVVNGLLVKNGGGFQIDHPLDAANKYLSHSFVESPDMKNLYDGLVALDANGQAEVRLPAWFETLNTDVRYQLTCLGDYAPVYIAEKLQNNRFTIAGGQAGMEVCWQVTGIRQDRWANTHRIAVEQDKPAKEQGYYLHPDLHGEPEEKSILHARYPDLQRPLPPQK